MSINHYKRSKVRSTEVSIFIDKEKFPDLIRRLKIFKSKNDVLQKTHTVWLAIDQYGWMAGLDKDGNINRLNYRSDEWNLKSMTLMSVIGPFVKPGGYIRLTNDKTQTNWVYKFDGKRSKRQTLTNNIIDFEDKEDLKKTFNKIVTNMMRLGFSKKELIYLIKKLFVQNILK